MLLTACEEIDKVPIIAKESVDQTVNNEAAFKEAMQRHLEAVASRDLKNLAATLSSDGKMQLILPGSEIMETTDEFLKYHQEWFRDTTWTFEPKILNVRVGDRVGMAVTEVIYREPERDGKPYFNRMIVSYTLEKQEGKWYVVKDHASSVEKSTDEKAG